jgi:PBSX family phage portal protein
MGRVVKVLFTDEAGEPVGEWASQQLPEDPFSGFDQRVLQDPPISLEQLVFLAETHPVHSAALEQKTADVIGQGWEWKEKPASEVGNAEPKTEDRDALALWFEDLAPLDSDMRETLSAVWLDVETVGWGLIEIVRDPQGVVRRLHHVPGHTVRAARDGFRLVQVRNQKKVWFRRWGCPQKNGRDVMVDSKTGAVTVAKRPKDPASDMLVIKRPSRRSSWYGIPGYVSAIGWITLAIAARDDNLLFFHNRREPRWAIVLSNLEGDTRIEEEIRRAFTVDLKQPHRNVILPIEGGGDIKFTKMSENRQEGSFDRLSERADRTIAIAHRVPGERLANAQTGVLGGNATTAANRVYKEAVVSPSQALLASRLNRFLDVEYEKAAGKAVGWCLEMDDLDLGQDAEEQNQAIARWKVDLVTLREAREDLKRGPLMTPEKDPETGEPVEGGKLEESPFNDMIYTELPGVGKGGVGQPPENPGDLGDGETDPNDTLQGTPNVDNLTEEVARLLLAARETHDELLELKSAVTDSQ